MGATTCAFLNMNLAISFIVEATVPTASHHEQLIKLLVCLSKHKFVFFQLMLATLESQNFLIPAVILHVCVWTSDLAKLCTQ